MNDSVSIVPASGDDAPAIAVLNLAARAAALPYLARVHGDDETRGWIRDTILRRGETWIAVKQGCIVGFLNVVGSDLDQLYVLPGYYRRGIGSRLLEKAKASGSDRLRLFTFARNTSARAFYESHGFRIVDESDGSRNEEHEPDVCYELRLDRSSESPRADGRIASD